MKIDLPFKWSDWTPIKEAFVSNGFEWYDTLQNASATYRDLHVVLTKAIGPNGFTISVKKYNKWIVSSYTSECLRLTIHFPELINELNHTATAVEFSKQESKAVEFKMQLYSSFLHDIVDNKLAVVRTCQGYADKNIILIIYKSSLMLRNINLRLTF